MREFSRIEFGWNGEIRIETGVEAGPLGSFACFCLEAEGGGLSMSSADSRSDQAFTGSEDSRVWTRTRIPLAAHPPVTVFRRA